MKTAYSLIVGFFCFVGGFYDLYAAPLVHTTQLGYEIIYTKSLSEGCNVTIKKNGVFILTNQSMGAICVIDTTGMVGIYSHGPAYQIYEAADGYTYILFNSSHFVFHSPYSRYSRGSASLLILKPEGTTKFIEIFTEISGSTNIPTFKYTFSAGGQLGIYYSLFSGTLNKFFQLNSAKDAFEDTTIYWNHHSMSPLWGDSIIQEPLTYTFSPLPPPTNLAQSIEMPDPEDSEKDQNYKLAREPIGVNTGLGYKIGHFQSGSGIILTASVDTGGESGYSIFAEVFASGSTTPFFTDEKPVDSTTGSGEILVPITSLPAGEYRWSMRVKKDGRESEVIEYGTNSSSETDFAIFDGFEPYPYGYKFHNNFLLDGILTGGIDTWTYIFPFYNPTKINGNKWDLFESAFDTTGLIQYNLDGTIKSDKMYLDAFDFSGLNEDRPQVFGGQCYGLSVSALMMKNYPDFINLTSISQQVGTGKLWQNIEPLHTVGNNPENQWDNNGSTNLEPILKNILTLQLSQASTVNQDAEELSKKKEPIDILQELKDYPDKNYVLGFWGKSQTESGKSVFVKHYVVPYKVEGNRIYYWDNNIQAPYRESTLFTIQNAYKQYIEVLQTGGFKIKFYEVNQSWISFDDLVIVDLSIIYNSNSKSTVIGFNDTDTAYSFLGVGDFYVKDALGRISGFFGGNILEQIPGVNVLTNGSALLYITPDNTFKQIYLPQKLDGLTLHIEGTTYEKYTLMIAGGDYYQKLEGVPTTLGQTDTFTTTGTGLTINFDDSKTGTYSLLVDNFHDYGTTNTGTVYTDSTDILPQIQQYSIDWIKVTQNTPDALNYQIDTNNDGTYDTGTTLPSIYHEGTEKKIYTLLHPQISQTQNSGGGGWGGGSAKQGENTQQGVKNVEVYQPVHTTKTGTLTPKPQTSNNSQASQTSKPGQISQTKVVKKGGKTLYSTRFYREDEKQMIQKNKQTKTESKEKVPPKLRTKIEIKTK